MVQHAVLVHITTNADDFLFGWLIMGILTFFCIRATLSTLGIYFRIRQKHGIIYTCVSKNDLHTHEMAYSPFYRPNMFLQEQIQHK